MRIYFFLRDGKNIFPIHHIFSHMGFFFFWNKLYESLGFQTSTVHCDCCGCSTCEGKIEIKDFVLTPKKKKKIVYTVCLILWTLSGPRRGLRSVGENMPRYSPKKRGWGAANCIVLGLQLLQLVCNKVIVSVGPESRYWWKPVWRKRFPNDAARLSF